jgi:Protein of unknown function (DUF1838)
VIVGRVPNRRAFVASAALAALLPGTVVARTRPPLVLPGDDGAAAHVEGFVRLQGDTAGSTTCLWSRGVAFAVGRADTPVPLLAIDGLAIDRFARLGTGRFRRDVVQVMLFRGIEDGKVLDRFRNPLTGRTVDVVHFIEGPNRLVLGPNGWASPDTPELQVTEAHPFRLQWRQASDRVVATRRTTSRYRNFVQPEVDADASTGVYDHVAEMTSYGCAAGEFADPTRTSVASTMSMSATFNFFPFLMSGREAGHMLLHLDGVKFPSPRALPAALASDLARVYPGLLDAPFEGVRRNSFREFADRLRKG